MPELVPAPNLDIRDEEQIAAQAIAFVSGGLTVAHIDFNIAVQRELRALVAAGGLMPPVCPELTNANPASPHTVLLEAQAWLVAILARRINQLPDKVKVEFARLFGIELREATKATALLTFNVAPPAGQGVTIPQGTTVRTSDSSFIFETTAALVLAPGAAAGQVEAERTVAGVTTLSAGTLTVLDDNIAWVQSVTNAQAVSSGSDAETIESALSRARNYQRRAERIVNATDLKDAILEEALAGNGIVRAFDLVKDGDFTELAAGHTTVIVMTRAGAPVSDAQKAAIGALLKQTVGNQFVYVKDPSFVAFDIAAEVRLDSLTTQSAALGAIEKNLRDFYAVVNENFGRKILRSEIIAIIEGTAGVDRIEPQPGGAILAQPAADVMVAPYQLPQLVNVTVSAV